MKRFDDDKFSRKLLYVGITYIQDADANMSLDALKMLIYLGMQVSAAMVDDRIKAKIKIQK